MNSSMGGYQGIRGAAGLSSGENMAGSNLGNKIPSGYREGRTQNFTPEQMQLFRQLFSQVSPDSYLSKLAGGDESFFEEMEAPAMRQFQELQGQLGSRFSGLGMGAQRGSGFKNAANQQTSDFAQDLASRRQQLQMNAIKELMGLSGELLGQRPYDNFLIQKQRNPSFGDQLLGGVGSFLGGASGGIGSAVGQGIGSLLSGLF